MDPCTILPLVGVFIGFVAGILLVAWCTYAPGQENRDD